MVTCSFNHVMALALAVFSLPRQSSCVIEMIRGLYIGGCREGTGGPGYPAYCFKPWKSSVQERVPGSPEGLDSRLHVIDEKQLFLAC